VLCCYDEMLVNVAALKCRGPCIVIHSYNNSQHDELLLNFNFGKQLNMFQTELLSIISNVNIVFTALGICHVSYVEFLLVRLGLNINMSY